MVRLQQPPAASRASSINDALTYGQDDTKQKLRKQLALFEVRHMIDSLDSLAHDYPRQPGCTSSQTKGQIPSSFNDRCLELDPTNGPQGAPMRLGDCADTRSGILQSWIYNAVTGTITNWWFTALGGTKGPAYCLDAQNAGTRNMTPVQLWPCNGTDAQRWSYGYQPGVMSNAEGRVLDIQWGNSALGTPVWLYDRNETGAQLWGSGYWCN